MKKQKLTDFNVDNELPDTKKIIADQSLIMLETFKLGDRVKLKTENSPVMIVKRLEVKKERSTVTTDTYALIVHCTWYQNDSFKNESFFGNTLKRAT